MTSVALRLTNIKYQGCFTPRVTYINGNIRDNRIGLYLRQDNRNNIYLKTYRVYARGSLRLAYRLDDGRAVASINGLHGVDQLFVAIREETVRESGNHRKVLYGWERKSDYGIITKSRIRYVLAQKPLGEADWQVLAKPIVLAGLTELQQTQKDTVALAHAVTNGLGNRALTRLWAVHYNAARASFVEYAVNGSKVYIFGFRGYKSVFARITQEEDKIMARFFPDEDAVRLGVVPIMEVVLSEKKVVETGRPKIWLPLLHPMIISSAESEVQQARLEVKGILRFLTGQQKDGDSLDIRPRRVNADGIVCLSLNETNEKNGGAIYLSGYMGQAGERLFGRLVSVNGVKSAYFWHWKSHRAQGQSPLKPEGHVVAEKDKASGLWSIKWHNSSESWRERVKQTVGFGNWLYANKGDELNFKPWPVLESIEGDKIRRRSSCTVRKCFMSLSVPPGVTELFSVTRELQRRMKFMEFWLDKEAFQNQEAPFAARFVTVRSDQGLWLPFWVKLDNILAFQQLVRQGVTTRQTILDLFGDNYFFPNKNDYHAAAIRHLFDHLIKSK